MQDLTKKKLDLMGSRILMMRWGTYIGGASTGTRNLVEQLVKAAGKGNRVILVDVTKIKKKSLLIQFWGSPARHRTRMAVVLLVLAGGATGRLIPQGTIVNLLINYITRISIYNLFI